MNILGAAVRDSHMRLPLTICLDRENINLAVVKLLCSVNPIAVTERVGNTDKLPLQLLVESNVPNAAAIFYVAKQYPEAITLSYKQQDSPYTIALNRKFNPVVRSMMYASGGPSFLDLKLFRDLNWEARKIGFLLCRFALLKHSGHVNSPKHSHAPALQPHTPRRRHSGAAVSVSELSVSFKRDTGLSMISNISDDSEHSPKTSLSMSKYSISVNFYARLHAVHPDLFKKAVMYL